MSDTNDDTPAETLLAFLLAVGGMFLFPLVARDLWNWFVVPFGTPTMTYAWMFGLWTLKAMLTMKRDKDTSLGTMGFYFFSILISWGIGALCR